MNRTILFFMLLMVALTATTATIGAQDKSWETYKDSQGIFTLSYPKEWAIESSQDEPGYLLLSYSRMDNTTVTMADGEVFVEKLSCPMKVEDLSAEYDKESKELHPTYQVVSTSSEAIGELTFMKKVFTRQGDTDKSTTQGLIYLACKGSWMITMSFDTTQDTFDKMKPTLEKMAKSFLLTRKD